VTKASEVQTEGIVTSDVAYPRKNRKLFAILGAVGAIIVVLGGIYGYLRVLDNRNSKKTIMTQQELAESQFQKNNTSRRQLLESGLAEAKTPEDKATLYGKLSSVAHLQKESAQAIQYAKKAVAANRTAETCAILALSAEDAKDYRLAAEMYGEAARLIYDPANPETTRAQAQYLADQKRVQEAIR
jgi:uncharacterized protein HemY